MAGTTSCTPTSTSYQRSDCHSQHIVLIHSHYQAQSKDAALCVTPRTSRRGGAVTRERARGSPSHPCGGVKPGELKQWTEALDRITRINGDLTTQVSRECRV